MDFLFSKIKTFWILLFIHLIFSNIYLLACADEGVHGSIIFFLLFPNYILSLSSNLWKKIHRSTVLLLHHISSNAFTII